MALRNWREITLRLVVERIGPVAELVVEDALRKRGLAGGEIVPSRYLQFLETFYQELPKEIDRKALCYHLRDTVRRFAGGGKC